MLLFTLLLILMVVLITVTALVIGAFGVGGIVLLLGLADVIVFILILRLIFKRR